MFKSLSLVVIALLLTSSSVYSQLPVWPIVTGQPQSGPVEDLVTTTPHQYVDWGVGSPSAVNIPGTASNKVGPTQAGINGCNELMFFTLHNGSFNSATAALQIYTQAGAYLPLPGGDMNASAGDDEVQIVRRPGYPNQWFVIYNLAPAVYPSGHPGYQSCFLAYSLIEVNSTSATYVNDITGIPIKDRIIDVGGTNFQYFNGKATSRTSVVVGGDHDIYAQRRTQAFGSGAIGSTFVVDRFTITNSDAITWTGSSSVVNGYSWGLMASGSPIELSPTENSLAVMARTQTDDEQQIYLFDPANLAAAPNTITISKLQIEFTAPPAPLAGLYHQAEEFDVTVGNTYDWLRNFEKKISGLEYSPNGNYLYISGGGYVAGYQQNLTYLGQIDLTQTISGDHPVRLQVQQANSANTYNATSGGGNTWTAGNLTNLWDISGMSRIQSSFDGNLYFTKSHSQNLFVLPSPNSLLPINMVPGDIDFSTGLVPNIPMNGYTVMMPDQIDGFDYSINNFSSVTFNVSNQSLCTCDPIEIAVVNANTLDTFTVLSITECPTTVTLCVEDGETYHLLGDNGINFDNAIVSGNHVYPMGASMFNFGNGGAFSTSFTTVTTPLITSDEAWDGKYYIPDNMIVVVDNATLDLTNVDLVFGDCAGIDFISGSQLRANNSVFRPCDINGVWRGLNFYSTNTVLPDPTAIINESTFKNAQRAISAFEMNVADIRVTNNLFSNCKAGVNLENTRFSRSISGNTFLLDDLVPSFDESECTWNGESDFVGVNSIGVRYLESITQNDFVAPDFTTVKFTGVISVGDREISINSNNFTNTHKSVFAVEDHNTKIESNEINVTSTFFGYEHQISVMSSTNTLIGDNTIVNSSQYQVTAWAGNNSAIYCFSGDSYDIKENRINGFETAIQCVDVKNIHITDNEIGNSFFYGIYMENLIEVQASCNTINMELTENGNSTGIGYFTANSEETNNEISSNCISETNTAMHLESTSATPSLMPIILNNYMYNYTDYGVEAVNMMGNIGSSPSPATGAGRNTFVTNNGLGVTADIASTNPMTSYGNFGVSFVSGSISIAGNNVNSTASCGHQIDLANSSGGYVEVCDDLSGKVVKMVTSGGNLTNDFAEAIPEATFSQLVFSLHTLKRSTNPTDITTFYHEVLNTGTISEHEANWFTFDYNLLVNDVNEALIALNTIVPENEGEQDLIQIKKVLLEYDGSLTQGQIGILEGLATDSKYAHLAIALLVDAGVMSEKVYYPTLSPTHINKNNDLVVVDGTSLAVYPNPSNGMISFEYSVEEGQRVELEVFDVAGKRVNAIPLEYQHSVQNIDLSELRGGVYTLCITSEDGILAKSKLVKY